MREFAGTERFEIIRSLGRGGMGVVYEALDREQGRRVAIKTLPLSTPELLVHLKREFRAVQDIHHTNLISLGELIEYQGTWFFTMELIEGEPFSEYVRPRQEGAASSMAFAPTAVGLPAVDDPTEASAPTSVSSRSFDETRLRDALGQLARGVAALHRSGQVHRDIKPSNILVTEAGRVVILDFGLVADTLDAGASLPGFAVGTAAYMSPEQAAAKPTRPAADWYSVGVVLYEALTGRVPIDDAPFQIMLRKQREQPPPPSAAVSGVPADLDRLCLDLLAPDPDQRPDADQVLQRLGIAEPPVAVPPSRISSQGSAFVGRASELGELEQALSDVRAGRAVSLVVRGPSGIGKTRLLRRFLDGLPDDVLVLEGRCYERESVPFKAFDGIADALGNYLGKHPNAIPPPKNIGFVGRVFPSLRRYATRGTDGQIVVRSRLDPREQRDRMFDGTRVLLRSLSENQPMVLAIEDMQWSDRDSIALMGEIMREPDAPRMLFLATTRTPAQQAMAQVQAYSNLVKGDVRMVELGPLSHEESMCLAEHLLTAAGAPASQSASIASGTHGHPLLIHEMARYAAAEERVADPDTGLEQAIWSRVSSCDQTARRVLQMVAVAGSPLPLDAVADAVQVPLGELVRIAAELRVAHLASTRGLRANDRIEVYHDAVRAAVLAHLDDDERLAWHLRIANALDGLTEVDSEAASANYFRAGRIDKAAVHAARAAGQANAAWAFERAARLYSRALELCAAVVEGGSKLPPELDVARLRIARAEALANGGQGDRAADAFIEASELADPAQRVDLRRRAAQELLHFGLLDRGMDELAQVVEAVGGRMPGSSRRALLSLAGQRARLRFGLRRYRYTARSEAEIAATELARLDVFSTAAKAVGFADFIVGASFQTRHLRLALRIGEESRIARGLCLESSYLAAAGIRNRKRCDRLAARAAEIAGRLGDPELDALIAGTNALRAHLRGEFAESLRLCHEAERIWRQECVGVEWELALTRMFTIQSMLYLGDLRELRGRLSAALAQAAERRNIHALTNYRSGFLNFAWLIIDDPVNARLHAEDAMAHWSNQRFTAQHFFDLSAHTNIALYVGEGAAAYARLRQAWPTVERSLLLRVQFLAIAASDLFGRAAVAAAATAGDDQRGQLLHIATKQARALLRTPFGWSRAMGTTLRGCVSWAQGDREAAGELLRQAADGFADNGMRLHLQSVNWQLGQLLGDQERLLDATEFAVSEGVRAPARLYRVLAPVAL